MRCAYSSTTCPADDDVPWHTGGDIAAIIETPALVRVLIGDVMGHGPKAEETAVDVGRAFKLLAAHEEDPPQLIAARLDRFVASLEDRDDREAAGDGDYERRREEFVTAQFIDIPRGRAAGAESSIVCCGHPPPLLLRDGRATFLDAISPAPPLGLLDLAGGVCPGPSSLGVRAGDTVLLYTDGVTEARSGTGATYPLAERAAAVSRELAREFDGAPAGRALLDALKTGLIAHIEGKLRDDATLMCLHLADEPREGARDERATKFSNVQYS
jgi:serine phosphatase RsbU (regulator of sigma subunit)